MIGDRLNATVAHHLQRGLPDGRQIDNLVAWATAAVTKAFRWLEAAEQQGAIVVEVRAPIGPPLTLTIKLPKEPQ